MTSVSHEPSRIVPEKRLPQLLVTEMWASLAIIVIWLSVLADAIFGPDIVTNNGRRQTTCRLARLAFAIAPVLTF